MGGGHSAGGQACPREVGFCQTAWKVIHNYNSEYCSKSPRTRGAVIKRVHWIHLGHCLASSSNLIIDFDGTYTEVRMYFDLVPSSQRIVSKVFREFAREFIDQNQTPCYCTTETTNTARTRLPYGSL